MSGLVLRPARESDADTMAARELAVFETVPSLERASLSPDH
jgi:hypothetical protein